ncbi:MAG: SH3 domain-containing protein [Rhodovarius sp.]|nr:SH3 domain-containing protein [Rhodovarius sp.]
MTNLPLPRFVPLRSDRVNLRVGPDMRFPVEWRYERRDLPVMIIREHEQWRRIRDVDGTEGWVHQSNLVPGRRTFLVRPTEGQEVAMRRRADPQAPVVARLRAGVIGRLRSCPAGQEWCEVQVGDTRGFVPRSQIFGILPDEDLR